LWPNGWMDWDATWYGGRPRPSPLLDGTRRPPQERGTTGDLGRRSQDWKNPRFLEKVFFCTKTKYESTTQLSKTQKRPRHDTAFSFLRITAYKLQALGYFNWI